MYIKKYKKSSVFKAEGKSKKRSEESINEIYIQEPPDKGIGRSDILSSLGLFTKLYFLLRLIEYLQIKNDIKKLNVEAINRF